MKNKALTWIFFLISLVAATFSIKAVFVNIGLESKIAYTVSFFVVYGAIFLSVNQVFVKLNEKGKYLFIASSLLLGVVSILFFMAELN